VDRDGLRALFLLAAGGVLLGWSLHWVVGDAIGWTAYTPLDGDPYDDPTVQAVDRLFERAAETGWEARGAASAAGVLAALVLLACAMRPPSGRPALAAAAVLAAVAGLVLATGFSPDPIQAVLPGSDDPRPQRYDRDPDWGPFLTLIALGLGGVALAAGAWRGRPRGAALLVAAAALLATAVLLPWEVGRNPLTGDAPAPVVVALLLAGAGACAVAAARAHAPALVLLVAALAGIGLVAALAFPGGRPEGPYVALLGLTLAAVALAARRTGAHGAALAGIGGVIVLAADAVHVLAVRGNGELTPGLASEIAAVGGALTLAAAAALALRGTRRATPAGGPRSGPPRP